MDVSIRATVTSLGKNQADNFFYTYVMIFALYMVIMLYGQMVATNVATEKSSRAMEVLITSARPTSMMFGKVLASCLAGFIQIAAVFGSALVLYHINRDYWAGNPLVQSLFKEIITIVDKQEYKVLMDYVRKIDPKAFVTVYSVSDMRYQPKVY